MTSTAGADSVPGWAWGSLHSRFLFRGWRDHLCGLSLFMYGGRGLCGQDEEQSPASAGHPCSFPSPTIKHKSCCSTLLSSLSLVPCGGSSGTGSLVSVTCIPSCVSTVVMACQRSGGHSWGPCRILNPAEESGFLFDFWNLKEGLCHQLISSKFFLRVFLHFGSIFGLISLTQIFLVFYPFY